MAKQRTPADYVRFMARDSTGKLILDANGKPTFSFKAICDQLLSLSEATAAAVGAHGARIGQLEKGNGGTRARAIKHEGKTKGGEPGKKGTGNKTYASGKLRG